MIEVSILPMKLSGNRVEYFTRLSCGGRTFDVRKYGEDYLNRAKYERDELRHVLLGDPRPNISDPEYADKPAKEPIGETKDDQIKRLTKERNELLSLARDLDRFIDHHAGQIQGDHPNKKILEAAEGFRSDWYGAGWGATTQAQLEVFKDVT